MAQLDELSQYLKIVIDYEKKSNRHVDKLWI